MAQHKSLAKSAALQGNKRAEKPAEAKIKPRSSIRLSLKQRRREGIRRRMIQEQCGLGIVDDAAVEARARRLAYEAWDAFIA